MACQAFGGVIKKEERDNFIAFAKLVEAKKRTWVGLKDDDEIPWDGVDAKSFARAIEAKLKKLNT